MNIIRDIGWFLLRLAIGNLVILLFPVLLIVVPILVLHSGDPEVMHIVSCFYLLVAPLPAGFWFLFAIVYPQHRAAVKRGEKPKYLEPTVSYQSIRQDVFGYRDFICSHLDNGESDHARTHVDVVRTDDSGDLLSAHPAYAGAHLYQPLHLV